MERIHISLVVKIGARFPLLILYRWRDRQYIGPKKWLESALRDSSWQVEPREATGGVRSASQLTYWTDVQKD